MVNAVIECGHKMSNLLDIDVGKNNLKFYRLSVFKSNNSNYENKEWSLKLAINFTIRLCIYKENCEFIYQI